MNKNELPYCKDKSDWPFFINTVTNCLKNNKTFKLSDFMKNLQIEKSDVINITRFYDGSSYIDLQSMDDRIWSKVFHPVYGLCFTFDLSNVEEYTYVPYEGYRYPDFHFVMNEISPWRKLRILLHTKNDLPDAYQLNGRIHL